MTTVSIVSSSPAFTVSKIVCIGRNYAEHAKEMKAEAPSEPMFFLKPPSAIIGEGQLIHIPGISKDLHHEVEMTLLIGKRGSNIQASEARSHIAGYGIGLDMTLRDVQAAAKKKGLPWSLAKGFDTSAPLSHFVPPADVPDPSTLQVALTVNGEERQRGSLSDLLFPVEQLIVYISRFLTLEEGDVIYTGTPEGVAQTVSGDKLQASLLRSDGSTLVSLNVGVA